MGVDLGLQGNQLRVFLLNFRGIHFIDILLQTVAHVVKPAGNLLQLIFAGHLNARRQIAFADPVHRTDNPLHFLGEPANDRNRDRKTGRYKQKGDQNQSRS